jgi:hypothetical protein
VLKRIVVLPWYPHLVRDPPGLVSVVVAAGRLVLVAGARRWSSLSLVFSLGGVPCLLFFSLCSVSLSGCSLVLVLGRSGSLVFVLGTGLLLVTTVTSCSCLAGVLLGCTAWLIACLLVLLCLLTLFLSNSWRSLMFRTALCASLFLLAFGFCLGSFVYWPLGFISVWCSLAGVYCAVVDDL